MTKETIWKKLAKHMNILRGTIILASLLSFIAICYGSISERSSDNSQIEQLDEEALAQQATAERIKELLQNEGMDTQYHDEVISAIMQGSHENEIPAPFLLSIMKYESHFKVRAVSNRGAVGLMQIHPIALTHFNQKTNDNKTIKEMFDPSLNIEVACFLLRDLKNRYEAKQLADDELWDYVFGAYYKGIGSVRNGLRPSHKRYALLVKKKAEEYEKKIYDQESSFVKVAMGDGEASNPQ